MQISNPNLFAEVRSGNNGRGSEEGYSVQSGKGLGNLSVQHANYKMKTVSEALGHWATKTSKGSWQNAAEWGSENRANPGEKEHGLAFLQ